MIIECIKEKLARALTKLEKVTVKNPTLPVLKCILFSVEDGTLSVKATNLDVGIEVKISARIKGEGKFAIPGDVITHLISNIPEEGSVKLERKDSDQTVAVLSEKTATTLNVYPEDDFPTIPKASGEVGTFTLPSSELASGIRSVWFSASTSNIKPELSSIYIYGKDSTIYFVATDSFRLSEKRVNVSVNVDGLSLLLPYKNAALVIRSLEEGEDVTVYVDKNQVSFVLSDSLITSRVVDGVFPDYQQIIPSEYVAKATVLKEDLSADLKLNSVFSGEFKQVRFVSDPQRGEVVVETHNTLVGKNSARLRAEVEGDELGVTFNHKYISDCLPSLLSESVVMEFGGDNKPMILRGVTDATFLQLVMPMNK